MKITETETKSNLVKSIIACAMLISAIEAAILTLTNDRESTYYAIIIMSFFSLVFFVFSYCFYLKAKKEEQV